MEAIIEAFTEQYRIDQQKLLSEVSQLRETMQDMNDKKNYVLGVIAAAALLIQALPFLLKFIGWIK